MQIQVQNLVKEWKIAITVSKRKVSYVEQTYQSLLDAGWNAADIWLFCEPAVVLDDVYPNVIVNDVTLGEYRNWANSLKSIAQFEADAYFTVQDDVIFCRGLRQYLDSVLWPEYNCSFVSVFCPSKYAVDQKWQWVRKQVGKNLLMAQTLIFPKGVVQQMIQSTSFKNCNPELHVDSFVGAWAMNYKMPPYFHNPSLAQHIGEHSAVWDTDQLDIHRIATNFVGTNYEIKSCPAN